MKNSHDREEAPSSQALEEVEGGFAIFEGMVNRSHQPMLWDMLAFG